MDLTNNLPGGVAQFSLFITSSAVTREETHINWSVFFLFTDREGVDRARGVWEILQPAVKDGEVSERSPLLPVTSAHGQEITRTRNYSSLPYCPGTGQVSQMPKPSRQDRKGFIENSLRRVWCAPGAQVKLPISLSASGFSWQS